MSTDFAWLAEHSLEIYERYPGKWIAVFDGEVVGVGPTAVEAAQQAEEKHPGAAYILQFNDPDPERI